MVTSVDLLISDQCKGGKGMRLQYIFLMKHSVPPPITTQGRGVHGNLISLTTTFLTNPLFSPCFVPPGLSLCPSCPSQCVALKAMYPGGLTANSPTAGNKGCLVRPQSQRRTGKPYGPTPRQSGAGRNP